MNEVIDREDYVTRVIPYCEKRGVLVVGMHKTRIGADSRVLPLYSLLRSSTQQTGEFDPSSTAQKALEYRFGDADSHQMYSLGPTFSKTGHAIGHAFVAHVDEAVNPTCERTLWLSPNYLRSLVSHGGEALFNPGSRRVLEDFLRTLPEQK